VAGRQTAGRGRLGRTWVTPAGAVIHVSALLRPDVEPAAAPLLSLAAAVAAAEVLRTAAGVDVSCKWPNDLVVGERKLGGILTEANLRGDRVVFAVIGVGMNVGQARDDFPPEVRDRATSVAIEGGDADAASILASFLTELRARYGDRGDGLGPALLDRYRALCTTLGRRVRATTVGGATVEGVASGIGDRGELLVVDGAQRPVTVEFGEIAHLD
jgi:BirA family biotin operon repressor/biotin-[acetyl-CoA-carboxylase] ligase